MLEVLDVQGCSALQQLPRDCTCLLAQMRARDLRGRCFGMSRMGLHRTVQIPLASRRFLCSQLAHLFLDIEIKEVDVGGVDVRVVHQDSFELLPVPARLSLSRLGFLFAGSVNGTKHDWHRRRFQRTGFAAAARGGRTLSPGLQPRSSQPGSDRCWGVGCQTEANVMHVTCHDVVD